MQQTLTIETPDGHCEARLFTPLGEGPWPGIVFYMDGLAIRQTLFDMGQRLADLGYAVVLPDLFYRSAPYKPFVPAEVFSQPPERERLMTLIGALDGAKVRSDVATLVDWLTARPEVDGALGAVGYCMGGRSALLSATANPRVRAVASIHGGGLITEAPDSPHLSVIGSGVRVYVGISQIDDHFTAAHEGALATALHEGGVDHAIETYAGVRHGFTMADAPVYDRPAAERHWKRLETLFGETLKG